MSEEGIMQNNENLEENKKEANAFLRERYLYLISAICGRGNKKCNIRMFENTEVVGTVKSIDLNFENVIVENLKTPLPDPLKFGILRTSDILTMQFD